MSILIFDTETNGKPINYKAHMSEVNNWPRITQLAWSVYDTGGEELFSRSFMIEPDGWTIPKEKFFIDNNMSTERCQAEGMPIAGILQIFIEDVLLSNVDMMVAHNLAFDYPVLGAEMIRAKVTTGVKLQTFCTMKNTTNVCKIPGKYGYKWPTLTELHNFLFGEDFKGAHDALDDVRACAKSYFECVKRGYFL